MLYPKSFTIGSDYEVNWGDYLSMGPVTKNIIKVGSFIPVLGEFINPESLIHISLSNEHPKETISYLISERNFFHFSTISRDVLTVAILVTYVATGSLASSLVAVGVTGIICLSATLSTIYISDCIYKNICTQKRIDGGDNSYQNSTIY